MNEIKLLDVVAILEDVPHGLLRVEVGIVVEFGRMGCLKLSLMMISGKAYAFAAFRPDQLMKLQFRKDESV